MTRSMTAQGLGLLLVVSAACAAPGPASTPTRPPTPTPIALPFIGQDWVLELIDGNPITDGAIPATIHFGDNQQLTGSGGCNPYAGSYAADATTINVSFSYSTELACHGLTMFIEQDYFQALSNIAAWSMSTNALTLSDDNGLARLVFGVGPAANPAPSSSPAPS